MTPEMGMFSWGSGIRNLGLGIRQRGSCGDHEGMTPEMGKFFRFFWHLLRPKWSIFEAQCDFKLSEEFEIRRHFLSQTAI